MAHTCANKPLFILLIYIFTSLSGKFFLISRDFPIFEKLPQLFKGTAPIFERIAKNAGEEIDNKPRGQRNSSTKICVAIVAKI